MFSVFPLTELKVCVESKNVHKIQNSQAQVILVLKSRLSLNGLGANIECNLYN